jgi:hypothetical protein
MRLRHHAELALRQKQRLCVGVREWNCKNCFFAYKKKRFFFVFHHEQKEVKKDFVVNSKSLLFLTETLKICSVTSWFHFFSP